MLDEFAVDLGAVAAAGGVGVDVGVGRQVEDGREQAAVAVAVAVAVQRIIICPWFSLIASLFHSFLSWR